MQLGRSKQISVERGEFADFSFVATDWITQTHQGKDGTEDNFSSSLLTEDEEQVNWPFINHSGTLPISVVNQIVSYLSIEDISRAAQVCTVWKSFLWENIMEIDLSTIDKERYLQYWNSHIHKLLSRPSRLNKVRMNTHTTDDHIKLLPPIITLEVLLFKGCNNITGTGIKHLLHSSSSSSNSSVHENKLKPHKLPPFPILAELDLSDCINIDDNALESLSSLRMLKRLNLGNNTSITGTTPFLFLLLLLLLFFLSSFLLPPFPPLPFSLFLPSSYHSIILYFLFIHSILFC